MLIPKEQTPAASLRDMPCAVYFLPYHQLMFLIDSSAEYFNSFVSDFSFWRISANNCILLPAAEDVWAVLMHVSSLSSSLRSLYQIISRAVLLGQQFANKFSDTIKMFYFPTGLRIINEQIPVPKMSLLQEFFVFFRLEMKSITRLTPPFLSKVEEITRA